MSAVRIRPAESADLPGILEVERRSFAHPWRLQDLSDELACPDAIFLTAENGSLLGFLVLRMGWEEAELYRIAVAPEARGQGIGKALLRQGLEIVAGRGASRVFLEVRASNGPALALYHGLGFREVGRRRNYYDMPVEDALILALPVTGEEQDEDTVH